MPNWRDDADFSVPDRMRSNRHGAVREQRAKNPVFCEHDYRVGDEALGLPGDPEVPDDEALCANKAVRHTDPPRCTVHGGIHHERSRKRTEAGYVRVNPRMAELIADPSKLADLDEEELARGQLRNKAGHFGRGTDMVPRKMYVKMTEELFKRADQKMKTNLVEAAQTIVDIMRNPATDDAQRMKAAQWLVERVMGKTPDKIQVSQDKPWEQILLNVGNSGADEFAQEVASEDDDRL